MYDVYDVSSLDANDFLVWTENNINGATKFHSEKPEDLTPVFIGLSQGELSQTLLDYAKADFSGNKQEKIVNTVADIVQFSQLENLSVEDRDTMDIDRFENIVYNLPPEKMCGLWIFSAKTFFVKYCQLGYNDRDKKL